MPDYKEMYLSSPEPRITVLKSSEKNAPEP